jgi:hypothetical protein
MLVSGNICVGWIQNPIIVIFLVLVYSSTMRGAVNLVLPQFCPPAVAVGLTLHLTRTSYRQKEIAKEVTYFDFTRRGQYD